MEYFVAAGEELGKTLGQETMASTKNGEPVGMIGSLILAKIT